MPKFDSNNPNIIRIEPNPKRRSPVRIVRKEIQVRNGQPTRVQGLDGTSRIVTKEKEYTEMQRLPGTIVLYTAAIGSDGLKTGLEEMVDNPWFGEKSIKDGWADVMKNPEITRRELLEYKFGFRKGYFTNKVSKPIASDKIDENTPFYQRPESRVSLNDGVTFLNLSNPIHAANYYMLLAHKNIANSYEEIEFNSRATHYIVDVAEKQRHESKKARKLNRFAARLEELFEVNDDTIIEMCKALGFHKIPTDKDGAYNELDKSVRTSEEYYKDFMAFYNMWKDHSTRTEFKAYVDLYDYTHVPGLLRMKEGGQRIYWNQPAKDEMGKITPWEWKTKKEFINSFLLAPEYQEEVEVLKELFNAKARYNKY